jgi:hypothetical protein
VVKMFSRRCSTMKVCRSSWANNHNKGPGRVKLPGFLFT